MNTTTGTRMNTSRLNVSTGGTVIVNAAPDADCNANKSAGTTSLSTGTPVILHSSLENSRYGDLFKHMDIKLRVSPGRWKNAVIFPTSAVAFLVLHEPRPDAKHSGGNDVIQALRSSIGRFAQFHRSPYVIWHRQEENVVSALFFQLQMEFFQSRLRWLPVSGAWEGVQCMCITVKLQQAPACHVLGQRFRAMALSSLHSNPVSSSLRHAGLQPAQTEIAVVLRATGSLRSLAGASLEDLCGWGLDYHSARGLWTIFHEEPCRQEVERRERDGIGKY